MKKYALFVGIDISKKWIDVGVTVDGQKPAMPHRRFSNNSSGFIAMLRWIKRESPGREQPLEQWVFGMEHTGIYTLPLTLFLEEQGLAYVLHSGLHIKRSLGLKRGKDDQVDSKGIARYIYLRRDELKISKLPSRVILKIKNLLTFRARLIKYRNALKVPCQEMKLFQDEELSKEILKDTQWCVTQVPCKNFC